MTAAQAAFFEFDAAGLEAWCGARGMPRFAAKQLMDWVYGKGVVDMVITDLAVFARPDHASPFKLIELAPGVTAEDLRAKTTAHYVE